MQSDGLNTTLSPVIYGDTALSIKINTQKYSRQAGSCTKILILRISVILRITLRSKTNSKDCIHFILLLFLELFLIKNCFVDRILF